MPAATGAIQRVWPQPREDWLAALIEQCGTPHPNGWALPSQAAIATMCGLSPGTVNEKVRSLHLDGLIVSRVPLVATRIPDRHADDTRLHAPDAASSADPAQGAAAGLTASSAAIAALADAVADGAHWLAAHLVEAATAHADAAIRGTPRGTSGESPKRTADPRSTAESAERTQGLDLQDRTESPSVPPTPPRSPRRARDAAPADITAAVDAAIELIASTARRVGRSSRLAHPDALTAAVAGYTPDQILGAAERLATQLTGPTTKIQDPFAVFVDIFRSGRPEYLTPAAIHRAEDSRREPAPNRIYEAAEARRQATAAADATAPPVDRSTVASHLAAARAQLRRSQGRADSDESGAGATVV